MVVLEKILRGAEGSGLITYICEPKSRIKPATSPSTYEALVFPDL